jgi:hypothetical protein
MDRLKIMVGDKKVIQRFIGDKLVWESIVLLKHMEDAFVQKKDSEIYIITFYPMNIDVKSITKIIIENVEISNFSSIEYAEGGTEGDDIGDVSVVKFTPKSEDFEKITEGSYLSVKFWGRG